MKRAETWMYVLGKRMKKLPQAKNIEEAIELADQFRPPGQWSFDAEGCVWMRPSWQVRHTGEGWEVWRLKPGTGEMQQASVRVYNAADRARRWVELRLNRTESNLRGPATRAAKASTAKLPDIRVTPGEREETFSLLKTLGVSYASFVRAALKFAEDHLDGGDWEIVKEDGSYTFVLRSTEKLESIQNIEETFAALSAGLTPAEES